jgi:hypothetical protein
MSSCLNDRKLLQKLHKFEASDSDSSSSGSSSSNSDSSGMSSINHFIFLDDRFCNLPYLGTDSDSGDENDKAIGNFPQLPEPTSTSKRRRQPGQVRRIQKIPTDENGVVTLPIQVGVNIIHELGHVVHDRPGYHTDRYIFPVGYKSSRQFMSVVDPDKMSTYTCTILDGGSEGPRFVVTPDDAPDKAAVGASATGAWTIIIKGRHSETLCCNSDVKF